MSALLPERTDEAFQAPPALTTQPVWRLQWLILAFRVIPETGHVGCEGEGRVYNLLLCPRGAVVPSPWSYLVVGTRLSYFTKTTTIGDQGPAREKLVHEREAAENALADLRIEKAKVDGERKAIEADLGPVRYLATLMGTTDEATMHYFILVVALLLDPAAVLLLLATSERGTMLPAIWVRRTN